MASHTTEVTRNLCDDRLGSSNQTSGRGSAGEKLAKLFHPATAKRYPISDDVQIRFTDIGHLLGSACIEIWLQEGLSSGDVAILLNDPQSVTALVLESRVTG